MLGCTVLVAVLLGAACACSFILWKLLFSCYIDPLKALHRLRNHGFTGPNPTFPFGNLKDMKKIIDEQETLLNSNIIPDPSSQSQTSAPLISHDIHPTCLPHFAQWKKSYGKVFIYWMGTEPFVYVADPEFLKQMSAQVPIGKNWGKPAVLRKDRDAYFGQFGLNVSQGNDWLRHKQIISRAFSSASLRVKANSMVECTNDLINQWKTLLSSCSSTKKEIDIENDISSLAAKIMAKTNFGLDRQEGKALHNTLRAIEVALFKDQVYQRYVGVPFGQFVCLKQTLGLKKLGKEADQLVLSIINERRKLIGTVEPQQDLVGVLLEEEEAIINQNKHEKKLTTQEIIDQCKTFFVGGYVTVAPVITWTLILLALNPKWQQELREEIKYVVGDREIDFTMLAALKKMGWVMNEVLRLYPPDLDGKRQAMGDIQVGETIIPKGTNIFIDILSMHHDRALWGDDVHKFKPERFQEDPLYGGCAHKMGYLPFGFGGRMCIGRNYAIMAYKIVLSLMLSRFLFSVSPAYRHCPTCLFNFRPRYGMPLIVENLATS